MKTTTHLVLLLPIVFLGLSANPSQASMLKFSGSAQSKLTASGVSVSVYDRATLTLPTEKVSYDLHLTGAGILQRKVGPIKVNALIATSYTDLPEGLDIDDPMASIKKANARVVQMTMARKATSDDIKDAFNQALTANDIDPTKPEIKSLMDQIDFEMAKGGVVTIAGIGSGGDEQVLVEAPKKSFSSHGTDLAVDFWKIWFGNPIDDEGAAFKDALLGKSFTLEWPWPW